MGLARTTTIGAAARPRAPARVPLYRDVKRRLTDALTRGEWKPGAPIPSERLLCRRYRVSVGTLRRAIGELVAGNILIRQQGRGTFVAAHTREREAFHFFHVVPQLGPGPFPDVRLRSFARGRTGRAVAAALAIDPREPVFNIRNVLYLDGEPIVVDDITLPARRFPGLTERQFRGRRSTIYDLYQEAFGLSVVRTRERLRAAPADTASAALLGVAGSSPLLQIRRVAYTYRDRPIEYRVSLVNTERHEYWAEIGA